MYKLKFIRGRSYNGYGIKVRNLNPLILNEGNNVPDFGEGE